MNRFYVVAITTEKYIVRACATSLYNAACVAKTLRTSWLVPIVRDGSTGKRYAYADLISSRTGEIKPNLLNGK
jgi:hypothetical protein